ncbi:uncharacterized protein KY384_006616 [Bacidia gigantensis]|uniref:uncharacterized protein n=1 Tax=Bacidia gigantensis TaxID=2732470 RepID=UPI001D047B44|nr:uncharacterized protein KY384_006616 [Bacidia gigantensis]KAG8528927.1 hypothetical protein KY384_006616 [Bacidia gigantensis]
MAELISSELWERSEGLYAFPESSLNADIKQMLYKTLVEYKAIFRVKPQKSSVEFIKTPAEAWKDGKKGSNRADNCLACDLSRFIRDKKAVDAICTLCKGRKKKGYTWPELLAFLSPVEYGKNENWRREFIKSSRHVTRMRRKINVWRDCGGDAWINDLRKAQEWDQGEEVPIVYSLTRDSELRDMGYSPPLSGETLHNAAEDSPKNDPFDDEGEEVPFSLPPKTPAKHDNPRPPSSQHHHSTTSKHTSDARSSRAPSVSHSKHSSRPSRSSSVSHHSRHQQEELLTPKVFDPHRSSHKSHTSSHAPSSHPSRTESVAHSKHSSHSSRHSTSSRTSRASSVSHASGYPQPDLLTPANLRRHESTLLSEVSGHTITPRRAEPKAPMRKSCAAESKRERASTVSTSVAYRALHGEYV